MLRVLLALSVFVTSDVVCIFVQLAGGALFGVSAGKEPGEGGISVDTATNVLMAGLILQVSLVIVACPSALTALQILAWVIFIAFLLLAVFRAYQYKKYPHLKHHTYDPMRWLLLTLTAVTLLIFWRACFRTAESAAGTSSISLQHTYICIYKGTAADSAQGTSVGPCLERTSSAPTTTCPLYLLVFSSPSPRHSDSPNVPWPRVSTRATSRTGSRRCRLPRQLSLKSPRALVEFR